MQTLKSFLKPSWMCHIRKIWINCKGSFALLTLPKKRGKKQQWSATEKVCKQIMLIAELCWQHTVPQIK